MVDTDRRRRAWDGWERERQRKNRTREGDSGGKVTPLGNAIKGWIDQGNFGGKLREADLFSHWENFVGKVVAEKSTPLRLERGRLILKVTDSVWRHQLLYMRAELIASINDRIGTSIVKEIVLTGS